MIAADDRERLLGTGATTGDEGKPIGARARRGNHGMSRPRALVP
jgi:hypothetical protein